MQPTHIFMKQRRFFSFHQDKWKNSVKGSPNLRLQGRDRSLRVDIVLALPALKDIFHNQSDLFQSFACFVCLFV